MAVAFVNPRLRCLFHADQRARRDGVGRLRRLRPARPLETQTPRRLLFSPFAGNHYKSIQS